MTSRDDFTVSTKRALAMRAAYICSRPECRTLTLSPSPAKPDDYVMLGVAAHITAAAPAGPRYDKRLSPEERKDIENGIFLCESCAKLIDSNQGQDHPTKHVSTWKAEHERWVAEHLNRSQQDVAAQVNAKVLQRYRGGALRSLVHEVFSNLQVLADPKFQPRETTGDYCVYPRVMLEVAKTVLASGSFAHGDDDQLLKLLFRWLEFGTQFNRRLEITEQFGLRATTQDLVMFQRKLASGKILKQTKTMLTEFAELLLQQYSSESGIDRGTVLFGDGT